MPSQSALAAPGEPEWLQIVNRYRVLGRSFAGHGKPQGQRRSEKACVVSGAQSRGHPRRGPKAKGIQPRRGACWTDGYRVRLGARSSDTTQVEEIAELDQPATANPITVWPGNACQRHLDSIEGRLRTQADSRDPERGCSAHPKGCPDTGTEVPGPCRFRRRSSTRLDVHRCHDIGDWPSLGPSSGWRPHAGRCVSAATQVGIGPGETETVEVRYRFCVPGLRRAWYATNGVG